LFRVPPEKRPLVLALVLALGALIISVRWPPTAAQDVIWACLMLIVAGCFAVYERQLQLSDQAQPVLRWVAIGLAGVAALWLVSRAA
jgi:hypothetical protein